MEKALNSDDRDRSEDSVPAGDAFETNRPMSRLIGMGKTIQEIRKFIRKVASVDFPVLICGETGVGKDLIAECIHDSGPRRARPFVPINCTNLPDQLFDAELFGYRRGAFTDAKETRVGLFEYADGGTILFDEISELPMHLQPKLLRALEKGYFRRLGENEARRTDVRVLFATNRNLRDEVRARRFRKDLYYRINCLEFFVPPLRERKEDIRPIVRSVLAGIEDRSGRRIKTDPAVFTKLAGYSFPGNIRELENIIKKAVVFAEDDVLGEDDIVMAAAPPDSPARKRKSRFPITAVIDALIQNNGNKSKASEALGISRAHLYRLIDERARLE
jgi:transcriptional regulator with GAF, ATPase, and Fis domain